MRRISRFQPEKTKPESKTANKEITKRSRISPPRRKIYSFKDLKIPEDCGSIDLSKKSIETFNGLPDLKYLTRINLDSNPLRSFEGSPRLPNLRWLSAKNSPISRNPYFKLMATIVFGNTITTINNEKVPQKVYMQADALRDSLYPQLLKGLLIANIAPLRFIDTNKEAIVNPEPSLLTATKKIGYKAPAVQEFERSIVEKSREQFRIPSIASICDEIIQREDEPNKNYFPDKFIDNFLSQLHDLRSQYNAKYENTSSEDYDLDEESNGEVTQSQESINDASPIKPPQSKLVNQAHSFAKHLIQSESDSEMKDNQLNIEEDEDEQEFDDINNSQQSSTKNDIKKKKKPDNSSNFSHSSLNAVIEEEDINEDINSFNNNNKEEDINENIISFNNKEEEEDEINHNDESITNHEEDEEEEINEQGNAQSDDDEETNKNKKDEVNVKNKNVSDINKNEEEEEENQNFNFEDNEEEEKNTSNNELEQDIEEDANEEENNGEEEEKTEISRSFDGLEQEKDEADANDQDDDQNENLSEDSIKSDGDQEN